MPTRISQPSSSAAPAKLGRNKNKKRAFDAYAAAAKIVPSQQRVSRHRLGEVEDEPKSKRAKRTEDSDDEEDEIEDRSSGKRPVRRATNANDDDDVEHGSDSSGNEWVMGGLAEDDEDSDIDSDEAFGESDEERFSGFTFRGSSSAKGKKSTRTSGRTPKSKQPDLDLNEAEEIETDDGDSQDDEGAGFGDDGVDLAAMLDDDDEDLLGEQDQTLAKLGEGSASDDESGDSYDEDEDEDESDESDGADEERVARLQDRMEALNSSSHSRDSTSHVAVPATLDDFLEDTNLEATGLGPSKSKKKLAKAVAISAPLPKRQQDRIDREVATKKAKEQLDRWKDTVVKNRRAEFLSFPLQVTSDQKATVGKDKFVSVSREAPRNELEENIQRIMEESGLSTQRDLTNTADGEDALIKSEELETKKLPVEEVMRRRAELRKARELLFREEIKAKRVAKIKSKSYRKVHRKERERLAEEERQALEEIGVDPMDEDEKEKADRRRAEARMGTKHRESKWAKSLKATGRAAWDESARDGVYEQARRNEELKRRIEGKDVADSERSEQTSDDDDDDDDVAGEGKSWATQRLAKLAGDDTKVEGLAGMKFMRDADERKRQANNEAIERLRKEMAVQDGEELEEESSADEGLGRAIFGPQAAETKGPRPKQKRLEFEAPEDTESEAEQRSESAKATNLTPRTAKPESGSRDAKTSQRPAEKVAVAANDRSQTSSWLQAPRHKSKKAVSADDAVEIITDLSKQPNLNEEQALVQPGGSLQKDKSSRAARNNKKTAVQDSHSLLGMIEDLDGEALGSDHEDHSFKRRAFAGDDVQAAFDAEKEDLANSEDEKETSSYLPGWGTWAGEGLSKKDKKMNSRAKHNPLFKNKVEGVKQANRKDAKLKNVIISEKNERKGQKYLASALPHEFESKEQYERSRRLPMGPEWTTKDVHQRQTRPRVVVKPGIPLRALDRPVV